MPLTNQQLREAFELFDSDLSGEIDQEEMLLVFKGLGMSPTPEEVEDMIRSIDADGDSKISFDEFCKLIRNRLKDNEGPREVLEAFKAFDVSNSGEITKDDLRAVADELSERVTDQDIDEIWHYCSQNDADDSGAGHFTFHAWRKVIESVSTRPPAGDDDEEEELSSTKKGLPASTAKVWTDLEIQEEADRQRRIQEYNEKEALVKERLEKAKDAKALLEKHRAESQRNEVATGKESKWRQRQEEQDIVRERLGKKKAALQAQKTEIAAQQRKEAEEGAAVQRKLELKKDNLNRVEGEAEEQA